MQETTTIGYKQTPIGLIPSDWEVKKLGEIVNYKKGFAFQTSQYRDQGVRLIRVSDTNAEGIKKEGNVYIDKNEANNHSEYQLLENDIVIQTVGSRPPLYDSMVGKTILVKKEFEGSLLNQNAVRIREKNGNNYFLFSLFRRKEYFDFIETLVRGNANQVSITLDDLFKYQMPYPQSLPEQQKIATILSTWDTAIDNCKAIIQKLQQRNKGLAQQLLTGKMRVKGFEKTNWHYLPINKIAKEISLKNPSDKELIVMSCTKYDGLVPSLEYFGRKIYSDDLTTYKIVKKGQFAYATNHIEEGSIGYQSKFDEALISPMYTVFQTDDSVNDNLLFKILKSHEYIHQYQKRMEGSIDRRGGLRWDEFSKIKVPVIDLEEQKAILDILDAATLELNQYQQQLRMLQQQKKGLMQQLLTGKVRVKI